MEPPTYGFNRPSGDIVTLLELTPRDSQDSHYFPLSSDSTWWLPDPDKRTHPFTTCLQQTPFRGPTSFGQRFTFDVKSPGSGDILLSTAIQIELAHWLDDTTILRLQSGQYTFPNTVPPWTYAKELGSAILEKAELEVNEQTLETIDGDFLHVYTHLFHDLNTQFGILTDGLGAYTQDVATNPFPTQSGTLCIPLPFFFQRLMREEGLPLLAIKNGSVRIHITLRPFEECVRRVGALILPSQRTPLGQTFPLLSTTPTGIITPVSITAAATPPPFKTIQLLTYSAHTDGSIRQSLLKNPFETMIRTVQTFPFSEPMKYTTNKTVNDTIQVQLPLEVNHPMEEIIWFLRRKASTKQNDWTNYSAITDLEYDPVYNPKRPLLVSASIYLNSTELITAEEQWYRKHIALSHPGGISAYNEYIYGYSFAKNPGKHQPSGTANASRLQSVRLLLTVQPPGGTDIQDWEVVVYVIRLEWLRFQNGMANRVYMD
jgi:hypothetical protein